MATAWEPIRMHALKKTATRFEGRAWLVLRHFKAVMLHVALVRRPVKQD